MSAIAKAAAMLRREAKSMKECHTVGVGGEWYGESAKAEYDEMIAAADAAIAERDALRAEVETTENDAAHQKALADSALRVAEGWERKCGELRAALRHEADCVNAAKAKIEAMERHAPSISPAALRPVIQWLRNGCDPVKAADELEMLAAAPEAKP